MTSELSWTPIQNEGIYCSPACGCGCTEEAYAQAIDDGGALALRLGEGWTSEVWENLGWHYKAISSCGRIKVHPNFKGTSFTAFLGEAGSAGDRWASNGLTPRDAVRAVISKARRELSKIGALLKDLS